MVSCAWAAHHGELIIIGLRSSSCVPRHPSRPMAWNKTLTSCWTILAGYVVLDDFGRIGRAWEDAADRETVIRDLLAGEYYKPVYIVAFNTAEGWSRDVSTDIADELRRRHAEFDDVPEAVLQFTEANRR
jgi:hypothetical protein